MSEILVNPNGSTESAGAERGGKPSNQWFTDDERLVVARSIRALQGDDESGRISAFSELVQVTEGHVYSVALGIVKDPFLAEEVVNDTYLRVWRFAAGFKFDCLATSWLYRVTRSAALSRIDKTRRVTRREEPYSFVASPPCDDPVDGHFITDNDIVSTHSEWDPEDAVLQTEIADVVTDAVAGLPLKTRQAVELRDLAGLPHARVAQDLDISESAAKVRVFRGHGALREVLAGFVETS